MSISRRAFIGAAAGTAVVSTSFGMGVMMPRFVRAALPEQTFFASSPAAAISAVLGTDQASSDAAVELKIPSMVETADVVPMAVDTTLNDVESITIVADENPNPIIAHYRLTPQLWPYIATRVRLAKSGNVHALVRADGTLHRATKHVDVSIGGCGEEPGPEPVPGPQARAMSHKMLIRTKRSDDGLIFRTLITHPMTPPLKNPETGVPTSGYFIQDITAQINGKTVLNGDWSAGVARDPYLSFKVRQAAQGDVIRLDWSDNAGGSASSQVVVE